MQFYQVETERLELSFLSLVETFRKNSIALRSCVGRYGIPGPLPSILVAPEPLPTLRKLRWLMAALPGMAHRATTRRSMRDTLIVAAMRRTAERFTIISSFQTQVCEASSLLVLVISPENQAEALESFGSSTHSHPDRVDQLFDGMRPSRPRIYERSLTRNQPKRHMTDPSTDQSRE